MRLLDQSVAYANRAGKGAIIVCFSLMLVTGAIQVCSRKLLGVSLSWTEELQIYAHIWLVFIAIPLAYDRGRHIRIDILSQKFAPKLRRISACFIDLLWIAIGLALIHLSVFYETAVGKTFLQLAAGNKSAGMGLPYSVLYACLVVSGAYQCLVGLRNLARNFSILANEEEPC